MWREVLLRWEGSLVRGEGKEKAGGEEGAAAVAHGGKGEGAL